MKILIITYYWPPSGGAGVQRWMYFAKHLKLQGMQPVIVTIDPENAAYPAFDDSLLKEVEGIEVHHSKGKSILKLYSYLKSGNAKAEIPNGDVPNEKKSLFVKLAKFVRANFFIPDARVGWNKYAFPIAKEIIKKQGIDLVITTGPPHSTHLIGNKLKKELNVKWIADLRDPWTEIYYNTLFKKSDWAKKKDEKLERLVLSNCDAVLTVGPSMLELLASKVDQQQRTKFHFLYNGFEDSLFKNLEKEKNINFTISYIGSMNADYPYQLVYDAIKEVSTEINCTIQLEFAGKVGENLIKSFSNFSNIQVVNYGVVPHLQAVQYMKNADLLILLLPNLGNTKIMMTGKLMEYLATNNPILCVGDPISDAATLVKQKRDSLVVANDLVEKDKIKKYLKSLISNQNIIGNQENPFVKFSRKEITAELIKILQSL